MSTDVSTILWGRYRDWGNLDGYHFASLAAVVVGMMVIYFVVRKRRARKHRRVLRGIPRKKLPLLEEDMSRTMYAAIFREIQRANEIRERLVPEHGFGDPCWGTKDDEAKVDGVHFNTSISKSYDVLDKAASFPRPGLSHEQFRTIRDFVSELERVFPDLKPQDCEEFIRTYERSRFGNHKFTVEEFADLMNLLLEMVEGIQKID